MHWPFGQETAASIPPLSPYYTISADGELLLVLTVSCVSLEYGQLDPAFHL
jgi:hypothetical protein